MNDATIIAETRSDLIAHFPENVVDDILQTYINLLQKFRQGKLDDGLMQAGRFVEHLLRAIDFKITGNLPKEIKSVAAKIREVENATALPESLRLLIPKALYGMAYNIRSKRDAVHVKEIDARPIDLAMCVAAASWTVAELIREFHISDARDVESRMAALSRTKIPLIESINGEVFVSRKVKPKTEILLLLAHNVTAGLSRRELGVAAKCSPSSVTTSLQALMGERFVHQSIDARYHITSEGESHLSKILIV
ncbi:hypothetical protein FSZ31_02940 [Sphingorhabdus soli]|uniref:Uncharacterized protein n=1 Tax=Flavisphingopyxis soli TaxID=2601267 RepID=A0A5C6USC3_9SPHN|nr:hypothetical protein [Sphingorhabdus soli]TXC73705.1 hypothetical protein FSZ31_02940 [Sphingorhabdus soli]